MLKSLVSIISCLALTLSCNVRPKASVPQAPPSLQQKASHMIRIVVIDKEGDEHSDGVCTATAVGPHVLLTAEHCIEKQDNAVKIDLSPNTYKILDRVSDHREHVMIAVEGVPFKNFIDLSTQSREVVPKEHVYIYGCGGGEYPPRLLTGVHTPGFDSASEVDQAIGINKFTIPVIRGDSGSAIYGDDGKIVALVTYGHNHELVGFSLDFSPTDVKIALEVGAGQTI